MKINDECIFCRIVRGEIPSTRVYEDDVTMAFLDISPLVKGHTLVIPKRHVNSLMETPDDLLSPVISTVRRMAAAMVAGLGADGVNVHQSNGAVAGQVVPHLHFHVVPRFANDGYSWNWKARAYDGHDEVLRVAEKIRGSVVA